MVVQLTQAANSTPELVIAQDNLANDTDYLKTIAALVAKGDLGEEAANRLAERFDWHPQLKGRVFGSVYVEYKELAIRDQALALTFLRMDDRDGTSHFENQLEMQIRWSPFAPAGQNWWEADPLDLAKQLVLFEKYRDDSREMYSVPEYLNLLARQQYIHSMLGREELRIDEFAIGALGKILPDIWAIRAWALMHRLWLVWALTIGAFLWLIAS